MNEERTVNADEFREFYRRNNPLAKEKLALQASFTVSSQEKMLSTRRAPKPSSRFNLARVMGRPENVLFPLKKKIRA